MTDPRRRLPGVDRLLASHAFEELRASVSDERLVCHLRVVLEEARDSLSQGADADSLGEAYFLVAVRARLEAEEAPSLRRVINATGVILHTNLGRSPLAAEALDAMGAVGPGYSNLEFDLERGDRGSRYDHCARLVALLTGAEDGLVVNNAAAALMLALNSVAREGGVTVSRGELIEIGGGFRIPEVVQAGRGKTHDALVS